MKKYFIGIGKLIKYNIKIIFGNKFIYFVLSAIAFYIISVVITLFSNEEITPGIGYNIMLIPSMLIIFYPACFGVQNDSDSKIIEIIFGIPNYRYKVWLVRLLIAYFICFFIVIFLSQLTNYFIVEIDPISLTLQVLMPTFFIGMLTFMISTILRNSNGTAVLIIVIFFILNSIGAGLPTSQWNIFINPFDIPLDTNVIIYKQAIFNDRLIISISSIIFMLVGLSKLQNREKFI